ncbi:MULTISPECIES: hypothetical protein [unclassified Streptomyces]|uniref:hypothetical protein n=1 Tax=unclassified Streptomyces TaxID=2593676 RepID=UPI0006F1E60A|nr:MULTISPECIES: hypothetical protein [unclassified Streptomyces]KQX50099.1 hypothetical protein ASD33_15950 [Streptomyces sp. Root1304]KRA79858.1 hypothetical protein ASE09_16960 [Streptomyces sp. Root66D1]
MQDVLEGLAANPALPEHLFEPLAMTGDEDVRHVLTYRDDLSERQARILRAYDDVDVHCLIANGKVPWAEVPRHDTPSLLAAAQAGIAPTAVIRELAGHHDPEVRGDLAHYVTDLPPDVLATLTRDPAPNVAAQAAEAPDLAEELARHPHVVVRVSLAHNDRIPPALLAALLTDGGSPAPTRCAACHPRTEGCSDHAPGIRRIRLAAAANPAVPPAGLENFLDAEEAGAPAEIADRTDLPPHFHTHLATHPAAFVRGTLARNPSIGTPLILRLTEDPDPGVRLAVAENASVPLAYLTALAGRRRLPSGPLPRILNASEAELNGLAASRVAQVRPLAAARPDLPTPLVDRFARDPDIGVARRIAPHPGLTGHQLTDMADRHGPPVYGALAHNPGCPATLLRRMARDAGPACKALRPIATHPASPPDVIEALLANPDPGVVRAAAAHPALPMKMMERLLTRAAAS